MKLAIFSPHWMAYSETFIANHINLLPFEKLVFTGREFPFGMQYTTLWYRLLCWMDRVLLQFGIKKHWCWRQGFCWFLRSSGIEVCLVEFGTMGAKVHRLLDDAKIPYVVHFHGYDAYHRPTLQACLQGYEAFFRNASAVVVVSRAMEKQLCRLGAPQEKIILNPYGVDSSFFSGAFPAQAPPHFVAVGRFVEKKAPHLLISAFRHVVSEDPEAKLTMIGDGPLLNPCKSLVAGLGMVSNVFFSGIQSPAFIRNRLRTARAFLQHSITSEDGDSEGMPLSVIEAQMSGLPVVSTRHAGIPDVVIDGCTGLLSDEFDLRSMAENILIMARDPKLASEMGINARQRAVEFFSLDRHISSLTAILKIASSSQTTIPFLERY